MRPLTLILAFLLLPAFAGGASAESCRGSLSQFVQELKHSQNPDLRSHAGQCLVSHYLSQGEAARLVLSVLRDSHEDILLQEDLMEALAVSPLRKTVKVDEPLAPKIDKQSRVALGRTLASAEGILAVTEAVKSMDEVTPLTRYEPDLFRAISDLALDEHKSVILQATAVDTLEQLSRRVVASGVYDDASLRLARDTLRTVANRGDNASFYSGARQAYVRLAAAGLPHFQRMDGTGPSARMLASEKAPAPAAQ